jgi:hypothetical protein
MAIFNFFRAKSLAQNDNSATDAARHAVVYWRDRAVALEAELKAEFKRNREREDALLERVLSVVGLYGIRTEVENRLGEADANGFNSVSVSTDTETLAYEAQIKAAFVEDSIINGISRERAEEYFETNKAQILAVEHT